MYKEKLQNFFLKRMREIFHTGSLDSYRVKNNNVLTLLLECKEVLIDWNKASLNTFDTVDYSLKETISAIEFDDCFAYKSCSKKVLLNSLKFKDGEECRKISGKAIYYIDKVISENKDNYLKTIVDKITNKLFNEIYDDSKDIIIYFDELNERISALASHLLYLGYSKHFLYTSIQSIHIHLENGWKADYFKSKYNDFINSLLVQKCIKRNVVFRFDKVKDKWFGSLPGFSDDVDPKFASDEIKEKFGDFFLPKQEVLFYSCEIEDSLDSISAIKKARAALSDILDSLHLCDNSTNLVIPNNAIVTYIDSKGDMRYDKKTGNKLDGSYGKESIELMYEIENLMKNDMVEDETKERLRSALRHLRVGNYQSDVEQRFMNYWIALEFLFSSPKVKSAFGRLIVAIVNIMTASYIKRNVVTLENILKKEKTLEEGVSLFDNGVIDNVTSNQTSELLKYRLRKIKPLIEGKSDKRKEYINNHKTRLTQHIARIYRLRNKLIHEAAIKYNIEDITSHLRYYLVFVVNQMILFLNTRPIIKDKKWGMDDMIYDYEMWLSHIEEEYNIEVIRKVPLDLRYL